MPGFLRISQPSTGGLGLVVASIGGGFSLQFSAALGSWPRHGPGSAMATGARSAAFDGSHSLGALGRSGAPAKRVPSAAGGSSVPEKKKNTTWVLLFFGAFGWLGLIFWGPKNRGPHLVSGQVLPLASLQVLTGF